MSEDHMTALDEYIAPGLRLWMLIGLIAGIMLIMVVIVCCFMRIRIPRTKRQIDLIAAKRKMRKQASLSTSSGHEDRNVNLNSLNRHASTSPRSADKSDSSQPLVHKSSSDTAHKTTSV
uniref:Transmembrane inner ear n=1 Tax=Steinernema glaseri TaxID=37863 RepID=A0A1I7ZH69_9BILA